MIDNLRLYESQVINVTWAGIDLSTGWSDDTFLTITPRADRVTARAGADGQYGYSKIADKGCDIVLTLQQTSPTYDKVVNKLAAQTVTGASLTKAPFTITDPHGNIKFVALFAVITKEPEVSFAAESGDIEFTWTSSTYISSENPSSILSEITKFTGLLL